MEATPNMCDTPGFPLWLEPKLVRDLRGFDRLELPQNHRRIVASSRWLLQGWRANWDIQPLLYECDPLHPNPDEIARVTDYIVAYACKGNETIVEEMKQMKALILGSQDVTGTTNDVKRIARKLLNKTTKTRLFPNKNACAIWLNWIYFYVLSHLKQSAYLVNTIFLLLVNLNAPFYPNMQKEIFNGMT